jgi:hypothetical protein
MNCRKCSGGVEAQAIEVKFVDPVSGIGEKELAHRAGVLVVEVDGLSQSVV